MTTLSEGGLEHLLRLAFFEGAGAMKEWMFHADNANKATLDDDCETYVSREIRRIKENLND